MPRRSLSGFRDYAPFLDVKTKNGADNNYHTFNSASPVILYADAALTDPMRVAWTPPVDAWWEVVGAVGLLRSDNTTYAYMYATLQMNITDADGIGAGHNVATQRSDVNQFGSRTVSRIFKLVAGSAYTCTLQLSPGSAVQWAYHAGPAYLWMHAKGWAR